MRSQGCHLFRHSCTPTTSGARNCLCLTATTISVVASRRLRLPRRTHSSTTAAARYGGCDCAFRAPPSVSALMRLCCGRIAIVRRAERADGSPETRIHPPSLAFMALRTIWESRRLGGGERMLFAGLTMDIRRTTEDKRCRLVIA